MFYNEGGSLALAKVLATIFFKHLLVSYPAKIYLFKVAIETVEKDVKYVQN